MSVVMEKLDQEPDLMRFFGTPLHIPGCRRPRTLGSMRALVIKSVLLDTAEGHVLAILPANRHLAMSLVREAVGDLQARLATEREIEQDFPAYELGALPPLQTALRCPVYVDPEVMTTETVVLASSHTESIRARTEDLFSGEWVTVTPLVRHRVEVG